MSLKSIRSLLIPSALVVALAGCGKGDDPSKLTCNDLGKITDKAVLDAMKSKCGIGGEFTYSSEKKEWRP